MSSADWAGHSDALVILRDAAPRIPREHLALLLCDVSALAVLRAPEPWSLTAAVITLRDWVFGFAHSGHVEGAFSQLRDATSLQPPPDARAARCVIASLKVPLWPSTSIAHPLTWAFDSNPHGFQRNVCDAVGHARAAGVPESELLAVIHQGLLPPRRCNREWVAQPGMIFAGDMVLRIDGREVGDIFFRDHWRTLAPSRSVALDRAQETAESESDSQRRHREFVEGLKASHGDWDQTPDDSEDRRLAKAAAAARDSRMNEAQARFRAKKEKKVADEETRRRVCESRSAFIDEHLKWLGPVVVALALIPVLMPLLAGRSTGEKMSENVLLASGGFVAVMCFAAKFRPTGEGVFVALLHSMFGLGLPAVGNNFSELIWAGARSLIGLANVTTRADYAERTASLSRAHLELVQHPSEAILRVVEGREQELRGLAPISVEGEAVLTAIVVLPLILIVSLFLAGQLLGALHDLRTRWSPHVD